MQEQTPNNLVGIYRSVPEQKCQSSGRIRFGDQLCLLVPGSPYTPGELSIFIQTRCYLLHWPLRLVLRQLIMFTPVHTSLGALLLFQGSSGLLFHNGAVFGISSLLSGCIINPSSENIPIIAGIVSSIAPVYLLAPSLFPSYPAAPNSWASVASTLGTGFLLGWGTKVRRSTQRMDGR